MVGVKMKAWRKTWKPETCGLCAEIFKCWWVWLEPSGNQLQKGHQWGGHGTLEWPSFLLNLFCCILYLTMWYMLWASHSKLKNLYSWNICLLPIQTPRQPVPSLEVTLEEIYPFLYILCIMWYSFFSSSYPPFLPFNNVSTLYTLFCTFIFLFFNISQR